MESRISFCKQSPQNSGGSFANIYIVVSTQQDKDYRVASKKPGKRILAMKRKFLQLWSSYILLMNRSLFTGLPFFPPDSLGVSVHISLTFSRTMLQCRSKALTRANSLRLFRHEMRTCVWDLTAVCRIDRGPDVNSCSSSCAISYSLP